MNNTQKVKERKTIFKLHHACVILHCDWFDFDVIYYNIVYSNLSSAIIIFDI